VIVPLLTIGEPATVILDADAVATLTLVTVPPPPPPPPVEDIVILPVLPDRVIPVPACKYVTPELVISNIPVVELAFTVMPVLPVKVLKGLAFANKVAKLVFVLLNAVYRESLPVDSFG